MDRIQESRKRGRDDDDDDDDSDMYVDSIHADKRQRNTISHLDFTSFNLMRPPIHRAHTLPFRLDHPPPLQQPPSFESTNGDSPSDSEPSGGNSPASFMSLPAPAEFTDVDMSIDESVSIAGSASPPSPYHNHNTILRPVKLNSPGIHGQFNGGRIPTPIHSNFQIGAPPRSLSLGLGNEFGDPHLPGGFSRQARPRLENDHCLPSPITEDYMETPTELPSSQLSRLSVSQDSQDSYLQDDDGMEVDAMMSSQQSVPSTPTGRSRMGRARSDAITGQSKRVVFGYRDDCAKCKARMPGHWAHFL